MATKTIGLTGRNYATMAAYSSYANALALTAAEIAEVYNDGGAVADTTAVVINGYTGSSGTNTMTLRNATGQGFRDNANILTNALRYNAANGAALTNSVDGTYPYTFGPNYIIDGLQFKSTAASPGSCVLVGAGSIFRNGIIDASGAGFALSPTGGNITVENSILMARSLAGGLDLTGAGAGITVTDCLIIAPVASNGRGIKNPYSYSLICKNTAIFGFANDVQNTADAASTNNATDKAVFGGANYGTAGQFNLTSAEWTNLTAGSEDFRVVSGSTKLKGNGATVGPTVGIRGNARSAPYTIGPDQVASTPLTLITGNPGNAVASGASATVVNGAAITVINSIVKAAVASGASASVGSYIQTGVIPNNAGSIYANQAVVWTWTPGGRVGSMVGLTPQDGSGTTDANGRLAPGIALVTGRLSVAVRNGTAATDDIFEQYF